MSNQGDGHESCSEGMEQINMFPKNDGFLFSHMYKNILEYYFKDIADGDHANTNAGNFFNGAISDINIENKKFTLPEIFHNKIKLMKQDRLILTEFSGIIFCYTHDAWQSLIQHFETEKHLQDRNGAEIFRANAIECIIEPKGSITIPDELVVNTEDGHKVPLIGIVDHIEIFPQNKSFNFLTFNDYLAHNDEEFRNDIASIGL